MKRVLLYTTGLLYGDNQTGGIKRQIELGKYISSHLDGDICFRGEENALIKFGIKGSYKLVDGEKRLRILPPEGRIALANLKTIKALREKEYVHVISFDVPPTIFLSMLRVKHIVLMIRKDLIGYDRIKNEKKRMGFIQLFYDRIAEAVCLLTAERVICQCKYDVDTLLDRHKIIAGKVKNKFRVQINNVNPSWIVEESKGYAVDPKPRERFVVGFIGGFSNKRKGQDYLLDAASQLIEKYDDIFFVFVGGGTKLDEYKSKYENDRIQFLGRKSNPIEFLVGMDILVVPSLAESCPNTAMEAMYNGIPVIGSNVGGIPELLGDSDSLFSLDVDSLAKKIEELYLDKTLREQLRRKQQARKSELTFDWAERIMEIIES